MKKLLIVDDDPDLLEALQMIFDSQGYETEGILKAEDAYSFVQGYQPDLILLDYLLSGVYGTDVCRELKQDKDTLHIPIIMFSAHPDAKSIVTECGAEDFIEKPFSIDQLIAKVEKLIA